MSDIMDIVTKTYGNTVLKQDPNTNMREILHKITSIPMEVNIIETTSTGDVKFSIDAKEMGISKDFLEKNMAYVCSDFFANFVGELAIRENINKFAKLITDISNNNYAHTVNEYDHKKFGMEIYNNRIIFWFHISLLQNILTEDFKKEIKLKTTKKQNL